MQNVERQIFFIVILMGASVAAQRARAGEKVEAADQIPPDAGAEPSAQLAACDAGSGNLPDLRGSDGQRALADSGLVDVGDEGRQPDARANLEVLPGPISRHADEGHDLSIVAVRAAPPSSNRLPLLGAMLDVGVPDGLIGSLVVRPWKWMRVSGGGGTNSISHGWRAGITLLPFGSGPSASLEYGRYQDGDANGLAKKFMGGGFNGSRALERLGYEYMNAHLGLDFGFRNVVFFLHGGVSMIRGQIHNLDAVTGGAGASDTTEVVVRQDPNFKAVGPSIKMGLLVYVW
jgi:hypothetical protein